MQKCSYSTVDLKCNCTYEPCVRKGKCCQCVAYHRESNELPACFFSAEAEKIYDRSVRKFTEDNCF